MPTMRSSVKKVARFLLMITVINLHWKFTECNSGTKNYGYIFTAPWVFDSDSTETVCLTLKGVVDAHGTITVKLSNTNGIIAQTRKNIKYGRSECFHLKVPATSEKEAFLLIDGEFDGESYIFRDRRLIKIRHAPDIILIQTDKDIYKAGQKVQFRVLQMTTAFLPSSKNIQSISIEDPLNVKVHEDKSPVAFKGIVSSSLQLSDEPEVGIWTIFVEDQAKNRINKTFRVDKYELQRFEIRINIPEEIRPNFDFFNWKVCANYVYGEAVKGQIKANITCTSNQLSNVQNQPAPPIYLKHHQLEGCLLMRVNRNDLGFHSKNTTSINYNLLNFYAEVTEHETGIKLNKFLQKEVKVNPYKLYILSKQYFKPKLSYFFKLLVKDSNDEPVKKDSFSLRVSVIDLQGVENQRYELPMWTDGEGLAKINIPAFSDAIQTVILRLTATRNPEQTYVYYGFEPSTSKPMTENSFTERLSKWKSPSDSYIKVEGPPQRKSLECNQQSRFTVHCTGVNDDAVSSKHLTIFYLIMTKNDILRQGNLSLTRNHHQMKDETATFQFDIRLTIEPIMSPKAEILVYYIRDDGEIVSDSEAFLVDECFGNTVGMRFNPKRSVPAGDVRVQLTASPNSLCSLFMTDKSAILLSGREFNPHKIFRIINDRQPNFPGASVDKQCTQVDPQLGPYVRDKNIWGSQAAFDTIGMMTMTDLFLELNPCRPVSRFGGQSGRRQFSGSEDEDYEEMFTGDIDMIVEPDIDIRSSFPETWLWELVDIGDSGQTTKIFAIPHTITNWIGNTFCVSPETGLGVSPWTLIISFQPVFLTLDLPYSARKTETIPVMVTVYSYHRGCFPVTMSLRTTQDFKLISHSDEKRMCVCERESNSHKYHIQPLKVGKVNISVSVSAMSTQRSAICGNRALASRVYAHDTVIEPINVLPLSTPKEAMHSFWICGHGEGKTYSYPLRMPSDGIKGTEKPSVKVSGDLIAPTVNGLGHLVILPRGSGSQNIVKFAPLVFVTSYLRSTNQLTNSLDATTRDYLQRGYQNQMKYGRADRGFSTSATGSGNMWLTAYVVKSFVKAQSMIYIDPNAISRGRNWITNHQLSNGCFTQQGKSDENEKNLQLAVTIALLESGLDHTGSMIDRAFQCIDSDANPSNKRLAMKAYATALARKTSTAQQLLNTLASRSIKSGDTEHWTNGPGSSRAINIETTSYVLLAIATLREGHAAMAMNILRWLIGQRTSLGGFSQNQDTVVAIQAIETFASQLSKWSTNMEVTVTSNNMGPMVFNVNQGNRLVKQTKRIPMSDALHVATTGQGCALLEIIMKYEIPAEHTSIAFYLDVTVLPYDLPTQQPKQTILICTRYQGQSDGTNMVLIEIEMVTGYQADDAQFQTLQYSDINLGKFENSPNKVVLYYNELKKDLLCFNVVVMEVVKAQNVKPAVIKVYDYVTPELSTTKLYTLLNTPSN